jgi:glycosyltransferase involved in cell wall biosynthesis
MVIPCFNEADRLDVEYTKKLISIPNVDWVFVDDGSTDGTLKLLDEICTNMSATVLKLPNNLGKSEAVRHGINHLLQDRRPSAPEGVGFLDADAAISLEAIEKILFKFYEIYDLPYDMLWASRVKLSGRQVSRSAKRHFIGRSVVTLLSLRNKIPYDTQCGFKVFKTTPQLEHSFKNKFHTRWFVDLEIYSNCFHDGATPKIWEEPLDDWNDVAGSHIRFRQVFRIIAEIFYIRYKLKQIRKYNL